MPRVRLLAPDARVSGAAGDVIRVDGALAHDLISEGLAVLERDGRYEKAIEGPSETTELR